MAEKQNQNALKHGAFAGALILPGEDIEDFEKLHASLVDEWNPDGPSENDKVMSVAQNMWRKQRFRRHLQNKLRRVKEADELLEKSMAADYKRLLKVLEEIDSERRDPITEKYLLEKLGKRLAENINIMAPRQKYDGEQAWLSAVSDSIMKLLDSHILHKVEGISIDEDLSDENLAERELAFEERLDAKIDRDIKQLGQMKTMKAIGLGKQATVGSDQPPKRIEK